MYHSSGVFRVEQRQQVLFISPTVNLGELEITAAEEEADRVVLLVDQGPNQHVVVDLRETNFFGSSAMGFFLRLRKHAADHRGRLALCHASPHEVEVLKLCKLDTLLPIYATREEALAALHN